MVMTPPLKPTFEPQALDNFVACSRFLQALEADPEHVPDVKPDFGSEELNEIRDTLLGKIQKGAKKRTVLQLLESYKQAPAFDAFFKTPTTERLTPSAQPAQEQRSVLEAHARVDVTNDEMVMPALEWGLLSKDLGKNVSPWFNDYVAFSKKWSPRASLNMHVGCALWTVSTVAARRIAIDYGGLQYTPLSIVLTAKSSVWGKTTTAKIATDVIHQAGFDWLLGSHSPTPEKLLSNMAGKFLPSNWNEMTDEEKEFERKRLAHSGQIGWYYSEFGSLIRDMANDKSRNASFKALLLRMDDCEDYYEGDTVKRGKERIEMPYLPLLGTMTPDCMKPYSSADAASWRDGSYPRLAFCCPPANVKKTREQLKAERFPNEARIIPASLLDPLRNFNNRLGERDCNIKDKTDENENLEKPLILRDPEYPLTTLRFGRGAKDALDEYGDALDLIAQDSRLEQFQACYSRLRTKTLRIATLIAGLEGSFTVNVEHIAFAQHIAEELRACLHHLDTSLHENNEMSERERIEAAIIDSLTQCTEPKTANEIRLPNRTFRSIPPEDFRRILINLTKDGRIRSAKKQPGERAEKYEVAK